MEMFYGLPRLPDTAIQARVHATFHAPTRIMKILAVCKQGNSTCLLGDVPLQ